MTTQRLPFPVSDERAHYFVDSGFTTLPQLINEVSREDLATAAAELSQQPVTQIVLTPGEADA
ncbi:hypothetical protein J2X68_007722 [Streptomyces sp. 3330]|uniref:hypothetical protein n=1 Tax=Streptomyces sp. 3330 TaxID=2817755 RepID=UPI002854FADE|nr:hypothetical protein [Streptomyces sp. 3330]MDR6980980.1 hypothetical protein [Streptomyces sp. 3330]